MVDIVDKKTRSRMMSGIRSSNTKPEVLVRKALHHRGYRYRLTTREGKPVKIFNIKPDILLRKHKVAVFTHGCYWHQHEGCSLAYSDRERTEKWEKKFRDNEARDKRVTKQLLEKGWRVAVIWECATRNSDEYTKVIHKLDNWIKNELSNYFESEYRKP